MACPQCHRQPFQGQGQAGFGGSKSVLLCYAPLALTRRVARGMLRPNDLRIDLAMLPVANFLATGYGLGAKGSNGMMAMAMLGRASMDDGGGGVGLGLGMQIGGEGKVIFLGSLTSHCRGGRLCPFLAFPLVHSTGLSLPLLIQYPQVPTPLPR
jgi:hypothetical protein